MNSAIEVITNVQMVWVRAVMVCVLSLASLLVISHLLRGEKKRLPTPVIPVWQPSMRRFDHGSGRVNASIPIRTVSSAPFEKNVLTSSGECTGGALGEVDEIAPRAADGLADLRVVARRPALQHQHQPVAVGHHRLVGVAHGVERLHPLLAARRVGEDLVEVVDRLPAVAR